MLLSSLPIGSILASLGALIILNYLWRRKDLYRFSWACNGPTSWPIIGSALRFRGTPEEITDYFGKMYKNYDSPIIDWFGPYPIYYVKEPEEVAVMFNSQNLLKKSILYKAVNWCFGDSILSTFKVDKWKIHRRAIAPSFNTVMLEAYGKIFEKRTVQLVKDLQKYAGKGEFDIVQEMEKYSLGNLSETIMGRILDEKLEDDKNYLKNVEKMKDYVSALTVNILYNVKHLEKLVHQTTLYKTAKNILEDVYNFAGKIMNERRDLRKKSEETNLDKDNTHNAEFNSKQKFFIDKLLDVTGEGLTFTDKEAFDQILIFMAAGSDTCAYTYASLCLMLGMHPEFQEKCYQEVKDLLGDSNRPITREDVQYLPYIERFIKETLRLFPVANAIGRESTGNVPNLGPGILPKGVNVVLNLIEYHRDPRFWKNPLKFDPDRFLPEEISKRHPYTWVPFSAGPRNCIGWKYGMIILVMTVASLVRTYRFSSRFKDVSELKFAMAIVTRLVNGHLVQIEERK